MADEIKFEDWLRLDLRVGKILKVEDIGGADKLYKLKVDIGTEKRTLAAGIKEFYAKEELQGKLCVVFCNLKPRTMRGIESQGMILAADENGKPTLIVPENILFLFLLTVERRLK